MTITPNCNPLDREICLSSIGEMELEAHTRLRALVRFAEHLIGAGKMRNGAGKSGTDQAGKKAGEEQRTTDSRKRWEHKANHPLNEILS